MTRFILSFCVVLALFAGPSFAVTAHAKTTKAKQAILIDYDTGMVLFEKNADEKMPTSSMSKVATIYMVFEALKKQQIALEDTFLVSEKAWRKGGSKMFVEVDKRVKVEDLIRGVVIQSGNDATIVLAEGLAGSEDAFAQAMNRKAKELGMDSTHFVNASGWPDPDHYSTAKDLATLSYNLIANFPEFYPYFSEKEFTYSNITQKNRNPLLYRNIGADGIKTGHTEAGGYGLMASGMRNGRRVILVINGLDDEKARAQESAKLLDWGLIGFENVQLFEAGDVLESAEVFMGKEEAVPLALAQDINITVPAVARDDLSVDVVYDGPVKAPIKKGQEIGFARINIPQLATYEIPLYAAEDVKKLGFFSGAFAKAKLILGGGSA